MKTPEQKLKFVMEAAGECEATGYFDHGRPSPDDIGKLMELARKLKQRFMMLVTPEGDVRVELWVDGCWNIDHRYYADTPQEALLNALFVAKGGK